MKFRHHRGAFADSMATVVEIKEYSQLKQLLEETYDMKLLGVHFDFQGVDERNKWFTYLVKANFADVSAGLPVGWSDTDKFDEH